MRLTGATDRHRELAVSRVRAVSLVETLGAQGRSRRAALSEAAQGTGFTVAALEKWLARCRGVPEAERLDALTPRWHGRRSIATCAPEAWSLLLADYLRPERPSFASCYERLRSIARHRDWQIPSRKVLRRRLEREVSRETLILKRDGARALATYYPPQIRDRSELVAMQAANADGHRFDVRVRWPDGEICRPLLVAYQDLASGKILSFRIDRTENADAIRLAFGDLVEEWGVPGELYLDNGRGFASKWMTGGMKHRFRFKAKPEDPRGIFELLGVRVHWVTPYHGQAKPIERAFRDLCDYVARHPSLAGAYTGSSPVTKPDNYGARVVELADFLRVVETEIRDHNARSGRQGGACAGRSFDETFRATYETAPIRRVTEDQRRMLLLAVEDVSVQRGIVRLIGNEFWCPELVGWSGKRIAVRFDPTRVQRGLYAYDLEGRYIGFAECQIAAGFADTSAARDHNRKRRSWMKLHKAQAALSTDSALDPGLARLEALGASPASGPKPRVVRAAFGKAARPVDVAPTRADTARGERQGALFSRLGKAAREELGRRALGRRA